MKHKYMPISVSINKKSCLVVGGGQVALRKVETLMDYDTSVTVIAPEVEKKIEYHAEQGRIKLKKREYQPPEAAGFGLVISASDDKELNKQIYDDAHEAVITAEFNLAKIRDYREAWGVFRDRRPETYKAILTMDGAVK